MHRANADKTNPTKDSSQVSHSPSSDHPHEKYPQTPTEKIQSSTRKNEKKNKKKTRETNRWSTCRRRWGSSWPARNGGGGGVVGGSKKGEEKTNMGSEEKKEMPFLFVLLGRPSPPVGGTASSHFPAGFYVGTPSADYLVWAHKGGLFFTFWLFRIDSHQSLIWLVN